MTRPRITQLAAEAQAGPGQPGGAGKRPKAMRGRGRRAGVPNRRTEIVVAALEQLDANPPLALAQLAQGSVPCIYCDDGQVTVQRYWQLAAGAMPDSVAGRIAADPDAALEMRACPHCDGTQVMRVDLQIRVRCWMDLMQYYVPKLKSIEVKHEGQRQRPAWLDELDDLIDVTPVDRPAKGRRGAAPESRIPISEGASDDDE